MCPALIPKVKSIVNASTLAEMEALLARALSLRSEGEVEDLVLDIMGRRFPP
jgi:phosphoenolpyruvate-protein kinase (PTS system EI component)